MFHHQTTRQPKTLPPQSVCARKAQTPAAKAETDRGWAELKFKRSDTLILNMKQEKEEVLAVTALVEWCIKNPGRSPTSFFTSLLLSGYGEVGAAVFTDCSHKCINLSASDNVLSTTSLTYMRTFCKILRSPVGSSALTSTARKIVSSWKTKAEEENGQGALMYNETFQYFRNELKCGRNRDVQVRKIVYESHPNKPMFLVNRRHENSWTKC